MAIKPASGLQLSSTTKNSIKNDILGKGNVVSIQLKFKIQITYISFN